MHLKNCKYDLTRPKRIICVFEFEMVFFLVLRKSSALPQTERDGLFSEAKTNVSD